MSLQNWLKVRANFVKKYVKSFKKYQELIRTRKQPRLKTGITFNEHRQIGRSCSREKEVPNFSAKANDFDKEIENAEKSGGKVLMPKTFIDDTGHFTIVQTPSSVNLALVEEK